MAPLNPWPMYVDVFYLACRNNDPGMMERLVTACSSMVHARLGPSSTPTLLHAITSSSLDVVRVLLRRGADTNATDDEGLRATELAVRSDNYELLAELLGHGADPSVGDGEVTLLMDAITRGSMCCAMLLTYFDPTTLHHRTSWGEGPLSRAYYYGLDYLCCVFLLAGADPALANREEANRTGPVAYADNRRACDAVFEWFEGQVKMPYVLQRARSVLEDFESHLYLPKGVHVPAYVAGRISEGKPLPQVEVVAAGQQAEAAEGVEEEEEEEADPEDEEAEFAALVQQIEEEEREAVAMFAVSELTHDLFVELMEGLKLKEWLKAE